MYVLASLTAQNLSVAPMALGPAFELFTVTSVAEMVLPRKLSHPLGDDVLSGAHSLRSCHLGLFSVPPNTLTAFLTLGLYRLALPSAWKVLPSLF